MKKSLLKNILLIIVALASTLFGGCVSPPKLPDGPVYFVDADSGKSVAPVLVMPNYTTFSGITTKMGHGPQRGKNGLLLANPFIYCSDGKPFKVEHPPSTAIILPFSRTAIVHKSILLSDVDVYAKGYKIGNIRFIKLLNEPRPATFTLQPRYEKEPQGQFARISDGLRNKDFEVLLSYPWIPDDDEVIEFDFTKKELKMMQDFFATDEESEQICP